MNAAMNISESPDPSARVDRGRRWPVFIVLLLGLNVGICAVTFVAALTHPVTIEPDYYDKAVRWDEIRELQARVDSAGLQAVATADGQGYVLTVRTSEGGVLTPDRVTAVATHESTPGVEVPMGVRGDGAGGYETTASLTQPGLWRINAVVTMGSGLDPVAFATEVVVGP